MFYQYSRPQHFYQRLHNILGTAIIKTGQYLGLLWLKVHPDGRKFTFGTNIFLIWSIIVTFIHISFLIYLPYYFNFVKSDEPGSNDLSAGLVAIEDVIYSAVIIILYVKVTFRRTLILKLVNYGSELQNRLSQWKSKDVSGKSLLYNITTKIMLDFGVAIPAIILYGYNFMLTPNFSNFLCAILQPAVIVVYCFITTVYYVAFTFGLFLMRKLSENMSDKKSHVISFWYQDIYKYLHKVNSFMEAVIFLFVFEAFVALVGEVRISCQICVLLNFFFDCH